MTSPTDELFQDVERALETDRHQVARLKVNRAWMSLEGHLIEKRARERTRLVNAMFRRKAEPVDQREVDYARGMIDTIDWILSLPDRMKGEEHS